MQTVFLLMQCLFLITASAATIVDGFHLAGESCGSQNNRQYADERALSLEAFVISSKASAAVNFEQAHREFITLITRNENHDRKDTKVAYKNFLIDLDVAAANYKNRYHTSITVEDGKNTLIIASHRFRDKIQALKNRLPANDNSGAAFIEQIAARFNFEGDVLPANQELLKQFAATDEATRKKPLVFSSPEIFKPVQKFGFELNHILAEARIAWMLPKMLKFGVTLGKEFPQAPWIGNEPQIRLAAIYLEPGTGRNVWAVAKFYKERINFSGISGNATIPKSGPRDNIELFEVAADIKALIFARNKVDPQSWIYFYPPNGIVAKAVSYLNNQFASQKVLVADVNNGI